MNARHDRLRRQRGIAMLEILGALAIGAILVTGLASVMDGSLEDVKGQQASYYQSQVAAAGQKYMAANNAALQAALPSATSLVAVGVPQLIDGHFLSANISLKNVYGQTPCVLIRQPDPISRPGQFDALVATSGGAPIPARAIAMVGANAGPGGGYIASTDTGNAKGASWSSSTTAFRSAACAGGAALTGGAGDGGHLASNLFYDGPGQQAADFLYRGAVPGRADLNRMTTPIGMGGNALVTLGAPCSEPGIAIEADTRSLATCGAAGVWRALSQWKDPVAAFADLPASGSIAGDVRMVTALARAFTWDGASWVALAVDQDGNMLVPGRMTASTLYSTGNIVADTTIHATGDISTDASILAGQDITATHKVVTQGMQVEKWTSTPAISIGINTFAAGAACHYAEVDPYDGISYISYPEGTVVMDANFIPLICGPDHTMRYANGTYLP